MKKMIRRKENFYCTPLFQIMNRFIRELAGVYQIGGKRLFLRYSFAILRHIHQVVFEKSLKSADDMMAGREICLKPFGKKVMIDGKHFGLVREIFCLKCYFPPLFGFEIKDNDTVVDLGCNVGIFTLISAKIAKHVVAVDALSKFLDDLKDNLSHNHCLDKVSIHQSLMGSKSGVFANEVFLKENSKYGDFPTKLSMNEILHIHQIDKIDFLKIDIEGSEFDLFLCKNLWLSHVRKIVMEVHQEFGELDSILDIMREWGFKVWLRNKNGFFVDKLNDSIGYMYARHMSESG